MPKKTRKQSANEIIYQVIVALVLALLVWNLGIITFLGYLAAFFGALKNGLFVKKESMATKLFGGTILIYAAGTFAPLIFDGMKSGDWIAATLMIIFAAYLWSKGYIARKFGQSVD